MALPDVAEACKVARDEIDALLWDRRTRGRTAELSMRSARLGARESAAIEGAEVPIDQVLAGAGVDSSPVGAVLGAALRVTVEVPHQVAAWRTAPLQALAALHLLAARDVLAVDDLGRPRSNDDADDPLHLGPAPSSSEATARLDALARVLTLQTEAPALVVAAIAHAEIMALRPFAWGSGLVARAAVRLVLADRSVDPGNLVSPEHGFRTMGRASYVAALRAYMSGTQTGMSEWLVWHAGAVGFSAAEARVALD
ncbi:unannotated protein [freshwater metagenome]|uniref:Unannotated protein n=1 Tax=freshwater metagenome TaxID=449393 RepID=A0A6J7H6U1_9ZZZZ